VLTVEEGLSGFSNQATITIGAMFVLSEGIRRTGALNSIGDFFTELGRQNYWMALMVMMVVIGVISAFINNTVAVAIFIPIVVGIAADLKVSASKLLMPLSFASMFGGVSTLIGTSTNILVSSIAQDHGEAAIGMFELTPLGVIFMIAGFAYLFLIGIKITPARRTEQELTSSFEMNEFLTDVVIESGFDQIGEKLCDTSLIQEHQLDVAQLFRRDGSVENDTINAEVRIGDVLRVYGNVTNIRKLLRREDVSLKPRKDWYDVDLEHGESALVEAVIAPNSGLEGQKIGNIDFYQRFGAIVLAIRHHGELQQESLGDVRMAGGDAVLLSLDHERIMDLRREQSFVVVSELTTETFRESKMPLAIGILVGVVGTAAFNILPIVVSAVVGAILLMMSGCLTNEEAYQAINWEVIFLLAGVLPLGVAMDKTGAAMMMADSVLAILGELGPTAVLSGFFFLAMILTNLISNQATAALLAPIAIQAAQSLDVSARPFLLAVTFAASLSFITPVGYQTNTLVYGPGQYKFTDFTKVGTPLNLLFWAMGTLLIPVFWPL
jgi:di/tricarboxylate transporter